MRVQVRAGIEGDTVNFFMHGLDNRELGIKNFPVGQKHFVVILIHPVYRIPDGSIPGEAAYYIIM